MTYIIEGSKEHATCCVGFSSILWRTMMPNAQPTDLRPAVRISSDTTSRLIALSFARIDLLVL